MNNSTISGNSGGYGEGIYSFAGGAVYLNNSTISNNQVYGLTAYYSPVTIQNSIIAHNGQVDCFDETIYNTVSVQSLGYNLVKNNQNCLLSTTDLTNVDPLLGSLENNGGSTPTHALLQGSPALDAGNPNGCTGDNGPLTTDQRGMPRVGRCDIGAFEEQNPFSAIMTVNRTIAAPGQLLHYEIIPWREGVSGLANILITNTLPVSITFLNNSLSATKGTVGYSNGTVTWNGSINANEAITISYDALVNLSTPVGNSINNSASINGGTVFTRTTATSIVSHFQSANKSVDKAEALRGDPLQFAIDFTGNSLLEATNVLVTDTLPTQLSYIPNSLTASSGNASFTAGTIKWNGTVNPGETVTILFKATVSPTAPIGTPIVNSAVINGGGEIITRTSSTSISTLAFLPFVSYTVPCVGICGYVTENGARVPGVSLQLRFYNGSTWSTVMSTLTGADGSYSFTTASSLGSGQEYYVLYQNSSTNTRLSSWSTRILTSYTAGTSVAIGNFDIANIPLVSPLPDAIVSLPYTFQWTRRPATTSDSYEFDLFDLGNSNISAWTSPLGYVASYTLNGLPSQFYKGVWYGWYVAVYSPDGGYGTSYYYRQVGFLNSGSGPLSRIPSKAQPVRDSWQGKLPVQLESK